DADDLQAPIAEARKTFSAATQLIREARNGNGLLASLIKDSDMARDMRALIANLRAHGVLFYRDSAARATPSPSPAKRRSSPCDMTPLSTDNLLRSLFFTFCGAIGT